MKKATPRKAGEPVRAPLPEEAAERLEDKPGDLGDALQAFAKIRRQYRDTLKKLAE
jgi:hypothetical protein